MFAGALCNTSHANPMNRLGKTPTRRLSARVVFGSSEMARRDVSWKGSPERNVAKQMNAEWTTSRPINARPSVEFRNEFLMPTNTHHPSRCPEDTVEFRNEFLMPTNTHHPSRCPEDTGSRRLTSSALKNKVQPRADMGGDIKKLVKQVLLERKTLVVAALCLALRRSTFLPLVLAYWQHSFTAPRLA